MTKTITYITHHYAKKYSASKKKQKNPLKQSSETAFTSSLIILIDNLDNFVFIRGVFRTPSHT